MAAAATDIYRVDLKHKVLAKRARVHPSYFPRTTEEDKLNWKTIFLKAKWRASYSEP